MNARNAFCVSGLKNVFRNDLNQAENYYPNSIPSYKRVNGIGLKAKIIKKLN
jgi:hypothetical protein